MNQIKDLGILVAPNLMVFKGVIALPILKQDKNKNIL